MSSKRIAVNTSILGLSILAAVPSFASLDSELRQCAATALQAKSLAA